MRAVGAVALLAALSTLAACGNNVERRACMTVGTSDPLVTGAQLFRLDVYGPNVACAGNGVGPGAGVPLVSRTYRKGQPIAVDVAPGPHTLALTTYADAAGTAVLGRGCTQATLTPGAQICFDLSLTAASPLDLSAAVDGSGPCAVASDCGPDGGVSLGCCAGVCTDIAGSLANCGGCNLTCSTSHVTPACSAGSCSGACDTGFGDCNNDKRSDGCETQVNTIAHCSACGATCDSTFSNGASCDGTTCHYTSCKSGRMDCNSTAPNADGCECATPTSAAQGTAMCCGDGTQCETQHDNGLSDKFFTCAPLDTYDSASARAACLAHTGDASKCFSFQCGSSVDSVICDSNCVGCTNCNCWEYIGGGSGAGAGLPGRVDLGCRCGKSTDPTWN